jgi:hypothetical protein
MMKRRLLLIAALSFIGWGTSERLWLVNESLPVYSAQMHLHGSMSEGAGSMRGANQRGLEAGVDVLWWTDHDWRMSYHTYIDGCNFEMDSLETKIDTVLSGDDRAVGFYLTPVSGNGDLTHENVAISADRAVQGTRALKMNVAAASNDFEQCYYQYDVDRRRAKRSLASNVQLHFAVYPENDEREDVRICVRVKLSTQPPDLDIVELRYVMTSQDSATVAGWNTEDVKYVPLTYIPRQWNEFDVNLTADAEQYGLGGIDNSLQFVLFGVELQSALTTVYFDDYRITHELEGPELLARARQMAQEYTQEFGTLNYIGQELSYQAHLNTWGDWVPMIDYDVNYDGLNAAETANFVHANNSICSLNHIFKTTGSMLTTDPVEIREMEDQKIQTLINNRVYGADILEVGYPVRGLSITSFLRVWDALSAAGIYVTGNGISDTHTNGTNGWLGKNNFVTLIHAETSGQQDLLTGLQRGHAYFGDPHIFKGTFSVTTADGHVQGQVVETGKPAHTIVTQIDGLQTGMQVKLLQNGVELWSEIADGSVLSRQTEIVTDNKTFVRVEVWGIDDRPLVFSNPIYFVREGATNIPDFRHVMCDVATGLEGEPDSQPTTQLHAAAPNPFNAATTLRYSLAERQFVRLDIFDVAGRHVETLVDAAQEPGEHRVLWHSDKASTGVYLLRMQAGRHVESKKILLLR